MADIKHWNVCTRKEYGKEGQEKAFWPNVGQLTYFPARGEQKAGFKLELNMFPATQFYVFEQNDRDSKPKGAAPERKDELDIGSGEPEATGEINADDIPF